LDAASPARCGSVAPQFRRGCLDFVGDRKAGGRGEPLLIASAGAAPAR
jgi:hypothetical protein